LAPSLENNSAEARPIPEPAPVTMATLFANLMAPLLFFRLCLIQFIIHLKVPPETQGRLFKAQITAKLIGSRALFVAEKLDFKAAGFTAAGQGIFHQKAAGPLPAVTAVDHQILQSSPWSRIMCWLDSIFSIA
jgi:hypothetical protein